MDDVATQDRLRGLMRAAQAMAAEREQGPLFTIALDAAIVALQADGAALWVMSGDTASCVAARGRGAETLGGSKVPSGKLLAPISARAVGGDLVVPVVHGGRTVGHLQVTRPDGPAFDAAAEMHLMLLAESTAGALRNAARLKADDRTGDIQLVLELSRQIGSSLDLDHVLRTVVNLATRALTFDMGAIALYEDGVCHIRAVAGASVFDSDSDAMKDLLFRATWAAGTGESFYLNARQEPDTDAASIFLKFFSDDLANARMNSGLYLPLRDEEGILGILLFESKQTEFASVRQRDVAMILANQATVAIRNAKLYGQVPLAEALTAFNQKRKALLSLPRQRWALAAGAAAAVMAILVLVRWPLRVMAEAPVFRPNAFADVRPLVAGTVERVLVREGAPVVPGQAVVQLRDLGARAALQAAEAALQAATRAAAVAASRGDAAEQRLQLLREEALRADLASREAEVAAMTVRSPVRGAVLTVRPELLLDRKLDAGAPMLTLGRTDSLEIEFAVAEQEIARVRAGQDVHLRIDAIPQRTFVGRVLAVSAIPLSHDSTVQYPVRAVVANGDGVLKPGMAAYARVLTASESLGWRLVRTPVRKARLVLWRLWSWL